MRYVVSCTNLLHFSGESLAPAERITLIAACHFCEVKRIEDHDARSAILQTSKFASIACAVFGGIHP